MTIGFYNKKYFSFQKTDSMNFLYNTAISLAEKVLPASKMFSEKMKLFVQGREDVFSTLKKLVKPEDEIFWFHAASLGEYEQAVPIIEKIKESYPRYKILVTFFSPSGYENKKNSKLADVITYLPLDTKQNAEKFVEIVQPKMVFFMKYEVWPNFLQILKNKKIPTFLVSANFRKDQIYFKKYGGMMRKALRQFDHIFVQEAPAAELLASIGIENTSVSGDTRYDRVSRQLEMDNEVDFISEFKKDKLCVVLGSSWPEDEELYVEYINNSPEDIKWIIAPHALKKQNIDDLEQKIRKKVIRFSEMKNQDLTNYNVFILDTIGYLTRVYAYADIAYVGGAAGKTGLHNILEPAAFGVPVIIGKNYSKFPEASKLLEAGGLFPVSTKEEASNILDHFIENNSERLRAGNASRDFVVSQMGATAKVMAEINRILD